MMTPRPKCTIYDKLKQDYEDAKGNAKKQAKQRLDAHEKGCPICNPSK